MMLWTGMHGMLPDFSTNLSLCNHFCTDFVLPRSFCLAGPSATSPCQQARPCSL
jgi:hypothetical protein